MNTVDIVKSNNDLLDTICFSSKITETLKIINNTTDVITILSINSDHVDMATIDGNPISFNKLTLAPKESFLFNVQSNKAVETRTPFNIEVEWV